MEIVSVDSRLGKDIYSLDNGTKIKVKKGTGDVSVDEKGIVKVKDAEKVSVSGSKNDDNILIENSSVDKISLGSGKNKLWFNGCKFNDYNMWLARGTYIETSGMINRKGDNSQIYVNGDFKGYINAQQGSGKGYGDDSKAHKDTIIIKGNNNGHIKIDSHDKVSVKGDRGHLFNETVYIM